MMLVHSEQEYERMETVRDRLWLWGHQAGSHNSGWGLPAHSRMTPAEAAFYLGVPNLVMVRYEDQPTPPFDQHAIPFRPLDKVVWSTVGSSGTTHDEERAHVYELAARFPNISGVIMDDFFRTFPDGDDVGVLSVDELRRERGRLTVSGRRLSLWVVLYAHQLGLPVERHLELCDTLTFWTWKASDLTNLEHNFEAVERMAPAQGKILGCYMWYYGRKRPMPVDLMEMQCETGLEWLRQGRIEGMIFLASCVCDLELEAVEWTRSWIARVGAGGVTQG